MMLHATRERVDVFWAGTFAVDAGELHGSGVHVQPHSAARGGWREVYVLRFDDAALVSAPADVVEPVRAALASSTASDAIDAARWLAMPGLAVAAVVGPCRHTYVDNQATLPNHLEAGLTVRRLNPGDFEALNALRAAVGPEEWAQAAFESQPPMMFGLFRDGAMVAAANLMPGPEAASDVGIATRPDLRGRGYGTQVAAAAVRQALLMHGIARCRVMVDNAAAGAVAAKLGFDEYGQSLSVHLAG
jgi:GNAT superfamily N-acetyltransferase